ncbi:hypothetical protein AWB90_18110 [Mycobacterium paraense]|uniref:Transposase n=1 Tax=Mycobacterium paraense TaxID=767916 RepID=A0A1X2A780_9MYCO|nr:hypothetical protein [Mycobacterium paraense]ORW43073.1 hypothetical protein AWB90_18110 [Mycobacterium paraense]
MEQLEEKLFAFVRWQCGKRTKLIRRREGVDVRTLYFLVMVNALRAPSLQKSGAKCENASGQHEHTAEQCALARL